MKHESEPTENSTSASDREEPQRFDPQGIPILHEVVSEAVSKAPETESEIALRNALEQALREQLKIQVERLTQSFRGQLTENLEATLKQVLDRQFPATAGQAGATKEDI